MKHVPSDQLFSFDHAVIFNTMAEGIYVHDLDMIITYIIRQPPRFPAGKSMRPLVRNVGRSLAISL